MKRRNSARPIRGITHRNRFRSILTGLVIGGAALLATSNASAYCRTAACPTKDVAWQTCFPSQPDDCGKPLYWANPCVGFWLQKDVSAQVSLADAESIFNGAFATWANADCGGTRPTVSVEYQGTVECDAQEYNQKKGNANVITFRDDNWPHGGNGAILALTTVTYNLDTAEIYDADMELNSQYVQTFTTSNVGTQYDLLSIATHEAGHFLGLAHSYTTDATMFRDYKYQSVTLRDLTTDDITAICSAYSPTAPLTTPCNTEPRHGFSTLCGVDQSDNPSGAGGGDGDGGSGGGCTVGAPSRRTNPAAFAALIAALSMGLMRRRRKP